MIGQKAKLKGGKQIGTITGYLGWGRNNFEYPIVRYIWIKFDDGSEELHSVKKCHIL